MRKTYLILQLIVLCLAIATSAQGSVKGTNKEKPKVVKLVPPVLNQEVILEAIGCARPLKPGMFEITARTIATANGHKEVVSCYGHGGAGWTTVKGSIDEAVSLLEKKNISKETAIRIIGAGCMGLCAALELTDRGYNVAGITAKELYDIPSCKAAGYFATIHLKTSPGEQKRLNRINSATLKYYQDIARGKYPYITKDAVRMMPVYCSEDTESGVEELVKDGLLPPAEKVTLDFGNGVRHPNFVKYMTYFMDTTKLMRQMRAEVARRGIKITCAEVSSFEDCEEPVIFNCSGLGARELNQDAGVGPLRGHLMTLSESAGTEHMEYMIYTKVKQDGKEEYVYLFPKNMSVTTKHPEGIPCQGVLGGTYTPGTANLTPEELEALDQVAFKRMLERNRTFFYGSKAAQ